MKTNTIFKTRSISPLEIGILAMLLGLVSYSIYNLFQEGIELQALNQSDGSSSGLQIAQIEFKCAPQTEQNNNANKIRIVGPFCTQSEEGKRGRAPASLISKHLIKTQIENKTTGAQATVFTDHSTGRFSTDYIPLQAGKNEILVSFYYQDNSTYTQTMVITKN